MVSEPDETPVDRRARGRRRKGLLYLLGLGLLLFAGLSLAATVLRAPPRAGRIDLGGHTVRITVQMAPDPPKTGPIPVRVTLTNDKGEPAPVDRVVVRYGVAGQTPLEVATAPSRPGVYDTEVNFPSVGRGWIEIAIQRGNARGQLRLPVDVRPNI